MFPVLFVGAIVIVTLLLVVMLAWAARASLSESIWISLLAVVPATLFVNFASTAIGTDLPKTYVVLHETPLVSTRSVEGLSGTFFLGSGSIGTSMYYTYFAKSGEGFTPGRVKADEKVTIYEQDRTDGVLTVLRPKFADDTWYQFAVHAITEDTYRYEFRVPKGSVRQGFVIQ